MGITRRKPHDTRTPLSACSSRTTASSSVNQHASLTINYAVATHGSSQTHGKWYRHPGTQHQNFWVGRPKLTSPSCQSESCILTELGLVCWSAATAHDVATHALPTTYGSATTNEPKCSYGRECILLIASDCHALRYVWSKHKLTHVMTTTKLIEWLY